MKERNYTADRAPTFNAGLNEDVISVSSSLDKKEWLELHQMAKRRNITKAALIRETLKDFLRKEREIKEWADAKKNEVEKTLMCFVQTK